MKVQAQGRARHMCVAAGSLVMLEARVCGAIAGNKNASGNGISPEGLDRV